MSNVKNDQAFKSLTQIEGKMTFAQDNNGLHLLNFTNDEDAMMAPFKAYCKVLVMRDGNVYIIEQPKRIKNHPIFRDDNSSLTLGRDGKYYFVFILPEAQVNELPKQLVRQANAIAQKVEDEILCGKEER